MGEQTATGYLARGPASLSVVVLHEAFGLFGPHSNVPAVCDRLAAAGFQALAPDLYRGASAGDLEEALALMRTLTPDGARAAIEGAAAELRRGGARQVVVLGFCMGGAWSFRSALEVDGLAAAVVFYGTPRGDFTRLGVPVLGHFARRDQFVSVDAVRAAEAELLRAGKDVTFHYYDAEHAFMNETLPAHDPAAAKLAWERTLGFLAGIPA